MNRTETQSESATATLSDLSASDKHCVFRSGASWFSVPAISVREITISPGLVKLPNSHPSLAGLCHLRSEFIPVISLNTLLDLDSSESSQSHDRLMVLNGSSVWALLIAEAAALESLETIIAPDARLDESNQSPVIGTAMFREQIVQVLDPTGLFRLAQHLLESRWSCSQQPLRSSTHEKGSQR